MLGAAPASPTTIVAPTFDELVSRAQSIFLGEAVRSRSDWKTSPHGLSIVTVVTFKVVRVLKGSVTSHTDVEFLGGAIGGRVMKVSGMPHFRVGDRDVLFLSAETNAVSPLVGFSHGRFRVVSDRVSGSAQIRTHDDRPFINVAERNSLTLIPRTARSMTYAEFEALVLQRIAQGAR